MAYANKKILQLYHLEFSSVCRKRFATFAEKMSRMEKREQKNFFIKMVEDKKAIIRDIRYGVSAKVIEEERDVRFVTPL